MLRDEDPTVRELAGITQKLFKEIAHRLTSSNIKLSFRRLFNFIYIKKLKPLYNYNLPKDLTGSPMEIKETKNDNETFIEDNYEDELVKNEDISINNGRFSCLLEYPSEKE